tara:strand:- start:1287 stop:1673 length:387 start_codon:yes stop_codon:yes gene_type:complete
MKIIGNGVDIIENRRIKKSIKNEKFIKRIYSNSEIIDSKKTQNKINFFAKRFAAKEAFVKSIGTGFKYGINFNDITIKNKKSGKPEILLNNKLKNLLKDRFKIKKFKISLSLADENKYSIAFVIINKI